MSADERRKLYAQLYREALASAKPSEGYPPNWRSGAQRAWAKGQATKRFKALGL